MSNLVLEFFRVGGTEGSPPNEVGFERATCISITPEGRPLLRNQNVPRFKGKTRSAPDKTPSGNALLLSDGSETSGLVSADRGLVRFSPKRAEDGFLGIRPSILQWCGQNRGGCAHQDRTKGVR
jgi:hypothetical protein